MTDMLHSQILYLVPFMAAGIILIFLLLKRLQYERSKLRYSVLKNRKKKIGVLVIQFNKYKLTRCLLSYLADNLSMINRYSYEKNQEISVVIYIAAILLLIPAFTILVSGEVFIWYMLLSYIAVLILFSAMLLYVFSLSARLRFTGNLPKTYKILNSRYISKGNILKAIWGSMEDFDGVVKKEMHKIYDVLKINNMDEIEKTFLNIEKRYKNEHLTILLNLIKQAHYKGGNEMIKEQFEQSTEEILIEIENQKDLTSTSRSYIFLALLMPLGLVGIEKFNQYALGSKAQEFYAGPGGVQLKIIFMLALGLYIGYMLLLEKVN